MKLTVNGSAIRCLERGIVTTGMAGAPIHFTFDGAWDAVSGRTAVFRCGDAERQMVLDENGGAVIPAEVLHTPGHSPGSVLFYCESEKILFAGDTLFRMSVGRTDLQGGSWQQLMHSLHHVVALLPKDVKVFTGHGPSTTIGDETSMNPYFY